MITDGRHESEWVKHASLNGGCNAAEDGWAHPAFVRRLVDIVSVFMAAPSGVMISKSQIMGLLQHVPFVRGFCRISEHHRFEVFGG